MAESTEYRPPTQSQKPNMLAGSMPNSATSSALVDTATKCDATDAASPSRSVSHRRALRGVGERLDGAEGLRCHDEQRGLGPALRQHCGEIAAVDVRNEVTRDSLPPERSQGLVHHDRSEVGSADADVDDGVDAMALVAGQVSGADAFGEVAHGRQDLVHVGHHVVAVDLDRGSDGSSAVPCAARRDAR